MKMVVWSPVYDESNNRVRFDARPVILNPIIEDIMDDEASPSSPPGGDRRQRRLLQLPQQQLPSDDNSSNNIVGAISAGWGSPTYWGAPGNRFSLSPVTGARVTGATSVPDVGAGSTIY